MVVEKNLHNYTGYVKILQDDWGYPYTMKDMAARIIADWKFDEDCRKLSLNRDRYLKGRGEVV